MRTIAAALVSYQVDHGRFPTCPLGPVDCLVPHLEPTYIKRLPRVDGWRNPFDVESDGPSYAMRSRGRCGRAELEELLQYDQGEVATWTDDLVARDGRWIRWPSSMPGGELLPPRPGSEPKSKPVTGPP